MGPSLRTILSILFIVLLTSCQPGPGMEVGEAFELASSEENRVNVIITLNRAGNDRFSLSATFVPLDTGLHLYSKDIPRGGVEGLGRPTLFALGEDSKLTLLGDMTESVPPQVPDFEPKDLLVYPVGEVTLSIPVALPPGSGWSDEMVSVTYMACSDKGCRPPVVGKAIQIRVPNEDTAIRP
jgi:hypothetical protein